MADRGFTRRALIAGAVLLVAATALYSAAVRTENVVETHPTHADALRACARDRGWLPDFVPATATAIQEVHNLDSGGQWIRFALAARVRPAPQDGAGSHRRPPRWSGSWVRDADGDADGDAVSHHRAAGERGRLWCIVLDRRDSTVYGWMCGAGS
ncbi:hypothetical protein [Longimicrobium terrae]|uniref:YbbD head domain-containing protein n=1 Tax=Longimicrobium terrae TaxID=1639882 RepID=A0A841GPI9_9BACT|nr:hypothetical protein [Longimicrobium terrae]MBB4634240.1 hypothetical protein [Longimicrobium terrae]MBB6068870.1 hypothetical protein [Longimicrobium terrae]NNC28050.1 hypothetical protein [Longimicrobium terrae]